MLQLILLLFIFKMFIFCAVKELKLVKVLQSNKRLFGQKADFLREIATLKSLHHPNCVLFIGYTEEPNLAMITEYMDMGCSVT